MTHCRRILVVDPGMMRIYGHHYAYNQSLQRWFTAKGVQGSFLFSRLVPPEVLAEFPGSRSVFVRNPHRWNLYPQKDSPEGLRRTARAFSTELRAHADADAETLVFAHTLDPIALYGFALWQAALPEAVRPRLALNIMLYMADNAECRERLALGCDLLRQMGRARLFGGSRGIARLLSDLFGAPCAMLPTPLPENLEGCRTEFCPDRPVFGLIGEARQGKNLHILAPAVLRYLTAGGRGAFRIFMPPMGKSIMSALHPLIDLSLDWPEQIALHWRRLDAKEYYACLGGLTALIIPYSPEDYHACRPSGPVIEAAVLGVPIIACAGGFAEEELVPLDNGSLFMEQASAKDLAEALGRFEREKDARKARAMAACYGYAALHGTDAVMRLLLECGCFDPQA